MKTSIALDFQKVLLSLEALLKSFKNNHEALLFQSVRVLRYLRTLKLFFALFSELSGPSGLHFCDKCQCSIPDVQKGKPHGKYLLPGYDKLGPSITPETDY